jgi:SPP1 gp7 family putative phage head morphogenesis protein
VAAREIIAKVGSSSQDEMDVFEEAFLGLMRSEEAAVLRRATQAAVSGGRLRLPLQPGERQAFEELLLALDGGWAKRQAEIEARPRLVVAKRADPIDVDPGLFAHQPPQEFRDLYARREITLAGVYEADRVARVQQTIQQGVAGGASTIQIQNQLREDLPRFSNARLHNIARTEVSTLFNHGSYARLQTSPYVAGYEYFAVMDERTTDICASRHGRQWLKGDDPDVPPLHYQCRSELLPLFADDVATRLGIPADAPPPLAGFGLPPDVSMIPALTPEAAFAPLRAGVLVPAPVVAAPPVVATLLPQAAARQAFMTHARRQIIQAGTMIELNRRVKDLLRTAHSTEEREAIYAAAQRRKENLS